MSFRSFPTYRINGVSQLRYRRSDGTETRCVDVSKYADLAEIKQTLTKDGALWSEEFFHVAGDLSCTDWHYSRPSDQTELLARKDGDYIRLSGTFKGKAQDKTFKIGDGLWYQMKAYDCVKIAVVLTAFSWAWTGYYWYDKQSGQLVQTGEKGKNADKNGYSLSENL